MRCTTLLILLFAHLHIDAQQQQAATAANQIKEERFLKINGIEQWVTMNGDSTKPLVLFLHGGPGSPLSPYADAVYQHWKKDFLLVQWDQRGTARTYGRNAPGELTPEYLRSNPLSVQQMTTDGIELTGYLIQRFGKQKIILFGSSWGSILGVMMAQKEPALFYAYIGHAQIINPAAGNLSAYHKLIQLAKESKDQQSLDILHSIGMPPYDTARVAGKFIRIVKKYQQKNATPPPSSWFQLSPGYDNEKDALHREEGDDYSFVNYAGDKRLGIASIGATINFMEDSTGFQIPVYFIQGEEDLQTPALMNSAWFEKIKAPEKQFILLPRTEHGFNQSVTDAHLNIMNNYIVPAITRKNN